MAKNKFPRKEATDIFGHKIIRGNLVLFTPKRGGKDSMIAGIFLRENETVYTIAVKNPYNPDKPTWLHGTNVFLIKDPVHYMHLKTVRDALEIVDLLKDGKNLPKGFDVNIAWGIGIDGDEES